MNNDLSLFIPSKDSLLGIPQAPHSAPVGEIGISEFLSSMDYTQGQDLSSPISPLTSGSDAFFFDSLYNLSCQPLSSYNLSPLPSSPLSPAFEGGFSFMNIAPHSTLAVPPIITVKKERNIKFPKIEGLTNLSIPGASAIPEKPHACGACGTRFKRKHDLRRHERKHSESFQKFTCIDCSKSFTRSDTLNQHRLVEGGCRATNDGRKRRKSSAASKFGL